MAQADPPYLEAITNLVKDLKDWLPLRVVDATSRDPLSAGILYRTQWEYYTCTGKPHVGRTQDATWESTLLNQEHRPIHERLIREYWERARRANLDPSGKRKEHPTEDPDTRVCRPRGDGGGEGDPQEGLTLLKLNTNVVIHAEDEPDHTFETDWLEVEEHKGITTFSPLTLKGQPFLACNTPRARHLLQCYPGQSDRWL
jgi:hypothetical protein